MVIAANVPFNLCSLGKAVSTMSMVVLYVLALDFLVNGGVDSHH